MSFESATLEAIPATTISLRQFFLDKLEREAVLVRKTLERVPEGLNDFKPHERSMALGYLASIVAGILGWIPYMIDRDELDLDDPSNEALRTKPLDHPGRNARSSRSRAQRGAQISRRHHR